MFMFMFDLLRRSTARQAAQAANTATVTMLCILVRALALVLAPAVEVTDEVCVVMRALDWYV